MLLLLQTAIYFTSFRLGYAFGSFKTVEWFANRYNLWNGGTGGIEALGLGFIGMLVGLAVGLFGVFVSIIILHRLSKRFFPRVAFWRTTFLALLTTFLLLFLGLLFLPQ